MSDPTRRAPHELDSAIWRSSVTEEVDAELDFHLDMVTRELTEGGMAPEAARAEALRRFGDRRAARLQARRAAGERERAHRRAAVGDALGQDLRFAVRGLRRAPGFALVAILTLALGIGANSAIFSVINGVVLKPLAYPAPERLFHLTSQFPTLGFDEFWISPPEYFDLSEHSKAFGSVGAYATSAANLAAGSPERVNTVAMTASMFEVLGVQPRLGRAFTAEEDLPDASPVVVLSHELWERSFAADTAIVGRAIEVQGQQTTVVGVMPPGFDLHDARAALWQPLGLDPTNKQNRGSHFLYVVGRLAPSASPQRAQAELTELLGRWGEIAGGMHAPNDSTHRVQMQPLHDEVIGDVRTSLWVLQGAVLLVLLIACANMANLLLARAESRHKEFAVRATLGAGRARILRLFMAEGVVLAMLGGALGLVLAYGGLQLLLRASPDSIPRAAEVTLDPIVLLFTAVVALLTGLLFGLAPLLHVRERVVITALREGGTRTTATAGRNRVRRWLVGAEIALAVMLVIGAGLLLRSFDNLTSVDPGFDRTDMATYGVVMPQATYGEPARRVAFVRDLTQRLGQLPGVRDVAAMSGLPPSRPVNANDTGFEGVPQGPDAPAHNVDYYQVTTANYFDAMRIPMREGRGFAATDIGGAPVVVVNEALARRFYPNTSAIGRRIKPGYGDPDSIPWFTIVGVAADVKQGGLDAEVGTELYALYDQLPEHFDFAPGQMNVVLRSAQPVEALAPSLRRVTADLDPALPMVRLRSMDAVVGESVSRQRFLSLLLGVFAAVALALAAIGTYGILSYMVNERRREIGIRVALGADRRTVVGMVLAQGLTVAAAGVVLGVGGALALSRLAESLLFGVSPADPLTFATVAGVIVVVSLAACAIPARRAVRVDPIVAMRAE